MFLTLTIDTSQAKSHKSVRLHTRKFDATNGWRRKLQIKKRSLWQKAKDWKKSLKKLTYKIDGQVAMF
ncbi:hypothetical protein JKY72_06775 [Candidatus Gracilibacteria bacterium]|nr:hypothetical protein [Candidatus Gracilibacteria bacterium]